MKKKKSKKTIHPEIVSQPKIQPTNILHQYMHEISKYPILNREEEQKWSRLYHEKKDRQALRILVQSNLRFVVKVATEYSRFGSRLIDLIQEGNMGLLRAINEFNPYKGVRLITYAVWWIRGAIQEYLMKQHSIVRIGTTPTQKKLFYLLRKEQLPQLGSSLNTHLLSSQLGIPKKEIDSMKARLASRDMRLDTSPHSETSHEKIIDTQSSNLDEEYQQKQEMNLLKQSVKKLRPLLNKKETYILDHRILSDNPKTLQEIGNQFHITREAIRQLEARLLKKIKEQITSQMVSS